MPVCHNCGKEIEIGKRYCEQCGPAGEERVKRLLEMSDQTKYKRPARGYNRMLLISMLGLAVLLVVISAGIVLSIPTGPEYTRKAQAAVCRAHMREIERAVERYHAANKEYPPTGRVGRKHPLVTDQYLDSPLECPSNHHHYKIESSDSKVTVKCDSGLPGHEL